MCGLLPYSDGAILTVGAWAAVVALTVWIGNIRGCGRERHDQLDASPSGRVLHCDAAAAVPSLATTTRTVQQADNSNSMAPGPSGGNLALWWNLAAAQCAVVPDAAGIVTAGTSHVVSDGVAVARVASWSGLANRTGYVRCHNSDLAMATECPRSYTMSGILLAQTVWRQRCGCLKMYGV